jgi:hypothetical protein
MTIHRKKDQKGRDNQVSGPQTQEEKDWEHVFTETVTGTSKKGVPYSHELIRTHWGRAADCKLCEKEGRSPSVSKDRLSPSARQRRTRRILAALIVLVGIAVAAVKLSAQAASTPAPQLPLGTEPLGVTASIVVILAGVAVLWACFAFLRFITKGDRPRTKAYSPPDHSMPSNSLDVHGPTFLRTRAKCDSVEVKEPEPGTITGPRALKARESRSH